MKHSIEELQFAATVRAIANELRNSKEKSEPRLHLEMDERLTAHNEWRELHPLSEFIKPALLELNEIAAIIAISIDSQD